MACRLPSVGVCILLLLGTAVCCLAGADAWAQAFGFPDQEAGLQFVAYLRVDARPVAAVRYHGILRMVSEGERFADELEVVTITEDRIRVRLLREEREITVSLQQVSEPHGSASPRGDPGVASSQDPFGSVGPTGSSPPSPPAIVRPSSPSGSDASFGHAEVSQDRAPGRTSIIAPGHGGRVGKEPSPLANQQPARVEELRRAFGVDQDREGSATVEEFLRRLQGPSPPFPTR